MKQNGKEIVEASNAPEGTRDYMRTDEIRAACAVWLIGRGLQPGCDLTYNQPVTEGEATRRKHLRKRTGKL